MVQLWLIMVTLHPNREVCLDIIFSSYNIFEGIKSTSSILPLNCMVPLRTDAGGYVKEAAGNN